MSRDPLRILHLSTWDTKGGAARGAYWLHKALQQTGVTSRMLVAQKQSDDFTVSGPDKHLPFFVSKFRQFVDNLPVQLKYPPRSHRFSPAWLPTTIPNQINQLNPDVVNLHWICAGFLTPESLLRIQQPIVWTLRDMWGFTGGCHYALGCEKYQSVCGACPDLDSRRQHDLSYRVWQRKQRAWENLDVTIVAISHWLADCARKSSLFQNRRIEVIHNAINEFIFKPIPQEIARTVLNLPHDKQVILFGAFDAIHNPVKGFDYLKLALKKLAANGLGESTIAVVFGSGEPETKLDLGISTRYLGRLHDDVALALVYSAANVMVVPSQQEAFGKTAIEALACGIPVVSFDTTGLKDIVEHQHNGYRAECFNSSDLAAGISWVLQDEQRWQQLSQRAREKVEQEFTLNRQAQRYLKLYSDVLEKHLS